MLFGALIGYQKQWYDGRHFYLKKMFVRAISQRLGIGSQLKIHLAQALRYQEINRIYLLTSAASPAAEFNTKHGFYVSPRMNMMACWLTGETI